MVVSKQVLSTVTRMTVLNACKISTNMSEPLVLSFFFFSLVLLNYSC